MDGIILRYLANQRKNPIVPNFKTKRYENPEYRAWIKTKPCLVCSGDSLAHHWITVAAGGSDLTCVPLCPDHHTLGGDSFHRLGRDTFCKRHNIHIDKVFIELLREYIMEVDNGVG